MKNNISFQKMKFVSQFVYRKPLFPFLKSQVNDLFSEAIYITSPTLKKEYEKYIANQIQNEKEIKKLKISYYKYQSRSSFRCTPFGLFAGLGTGTFTDKNEVVLNSNPEKNLQRRTRLDMNIICKIAKELSKKDFIRPYLNFFSNTSLYQMDCFYRYVEYYYKGNTRHHKISKVDFSEYLEMILQSCTEGKKEEELIQLLLEQEIDTEEATYFIVELIDFQLIVSNLEPTVTGPEFFEILLQELKKIQLDHPSNELGEAIDKLIEIEKSIGNIDANITNDIQDYEKTHQLIKYFIGEISETNLFQTDLYFQPKKAELDIAIQNSILEAVRFLNKITPSNPNSNIEKFKKNFMDRYEETEVPLLQALDVENGIGYTGKDNSGINDLIDDLMFPVSYSDFEMKWNSYQSKIFNILLKAFKEDTTCVTLTDQDFIDIDFTDDNLPHSMAVKFDLLDATSGKINIEGIGGASATSLLGRFGHGNEDLLQIINEITQHETTQAEGSILAEIVHLPESRIGNILSRPAMRAFEIPYLAKSGVPLDCQIAISDLYISIQNGNIILRSKKWNKQIIPRLGNAHNFGFNALPVYQFLCDLQTQYYTKTSLYFNWGPLASQFTFLPRVEYKNTVLKVATWQLNKKDFENLINQKNESKLNSDFSDFIKKFKLPQFFVLADGDNELLIDSNDEIAILAFVDAIKNRSTINLKEVIYNLDKPFIHDEDGNGFTNECIAVLLNEGKKTPVPNWDKINVKTENVVTQNFLPGNEWLYFKIYCGVKTADYILTEKLLPLANDLLDKGYIRRWFFIRYHDTDNHLRFRVQLKNNNESDIVLKSINNQLSPLFENSLIAKIQMEVYQRETFRYELDKIDTTEDLFFADSDFCANTINMLDPEDGSTVRWQIALRATVQYLDDFELTLEEKESYCEKVAANFFNENNGNPDFKKQLNDKYRKLRNSVEELMETENDSEREILPLLELLDQRSERNKPIIRQLQLDKKSDKFHNLLFSYIHMMHNRLFISNQRKAEFIVYDLLARHYKSILARKKYIPVENLKSELV
jgi:lantibiotic biosynthesis protein